MKGNIVSMFTLPKIRTQFPYCTIQRLLCNFMPDIVTIMMKTNNLIGSQ